MEEKRGCGSKREKKMAFASGATGREFGAVLATRLHVIIIDDLAT